VCQLRLGIHEFIGFGVFIMFSRIHYVLEYSLYYYAIFGSPGGNHECAGMHNGGNVDSAIWAWPAPLVDWRSDGCMLSLRYSVFSMQYSVFSIHSGTYSVFTVFESSNGFPIAVVTGIHMFCMHVVWIDHEYSVGVDYHLELVYIWSRYSFKNLWTHQH